MTARTHILVEIDTNRIVNSVHWDGVVHHPQDAPNAWKPPENLLAIAYDGPWQEGWIWDGKQAVDPNPPPEPEPPKATVDTKIGMRVL